MALLATGLLFSSCSDDDQDDNVINDPSAAALNNEVAVTIDGEYWRGSIGSVSRTGALTTINANKAGSNIQLQIFLPTDSVNSFNIPTSIVTVAVKRNNSTLSNSPTGSMLLSSNDTISIKGTFNCSVTSFSSNDTLVLTNGEFDWKY